MDDRNFAWSNRVDSVYCATGKMEFTSNDLSDRGFRRPKTLANVQDFGGHVNSKIAHFLSTQLFSIYFKYAIGFIRFFSQKSIQTIQALPEVNSSVVKRRPIQSADSEDLKVAAELRNDRGEVELFKS